MTDTPRPIGITPLAWVVAVLMVPFWIGVWFVLGRAAWSLALLIGLSFFPYSSLVVGSLAWVVASYVNQRTHDMRWWHQLELLVASSLIACAWFLWAVLNWKGPDL
jgi:hypothetical protein